MEWFKHDSNAHRDVKLKKLMMRYGLQGYGLYFYCVELITDKISSSNLTFQLEDDAELLAHDLGIHIDEINSMMRYMVDLGLFEDSQGVITCMKIAKRLDQSMTSNSNFRKKISDLKTGTQENHDAIMTVSGHHHERKEQKRTEQKEMSGQVPPSVIAENWKPNQRNRDWLSDSGLSEHEQAQVVRDFVDYWLLTGSKKTNWDLAFRKNPVVTRKVNTAGRTSRDEPKTWARGI